MWYRRVALPFIFYNLRNLFLWVDGLCSHTKESLNIQRGKTIPDIEMILLHFSRKPFLCLEKQTFFKLTFILMFEQSFPQVLLHRCFVMGFSYIYKKWTILRFPKIKQQRILLSWKHSFPWRISSSSHDNKVHIQGRGTGNQTWNNLSTEFSRGCVSFH